MHTDYTVSAYNILIFDKYSVVFVRCTDTNQQLDVFYSSKCGIQLTRTVIAQWSKAQVSNLVVVRSSQLRSNICVPTLLHTADTYISYKTTVYILYGSCFL